MRIVSPYTQPQRWLKGNLHTHTTHSDGTEELSDVIAMYRDDNYDFLAITDHDRFFDGKGQGAGEMLLLSGQECHVTAESGNFSYHIVSLGDTGEIERQETGQAVIDEINTRGGTAILCHPRWSWMPYDLFDEMTGYAAFEVHNGVCEKEVGRGFSNDYWDRHMSRYGKAVFAVAVDDMHAPGRDFAIGWTYVNAEKTQEAILDALRRGDSYASCGPRIETISVEDGTITLCTSSAKAVRFVSRRGESVAKVEGENVKRASYTARGDEGFVRVEVHAHDGRIAWTNPFMIEPQGGNAPEV